MQKVFVFHAFLFQNFHHFSYAKSFHTNAAPPAPSSDTVYFVPRRGQLKPPDRTVMNITSVSSHNLYEARFSLVEKTWQSHSVFKPAFRHKPFGKYEMHSRSSCISQFQLRPASQGYCGAFARLVSPGGGGICKFCTSQGPGICQPRGHKLALDTHAVSYQNYNYNYTEGFTGKKADWLTCQGQE